MEKFYSDNLVIRDKYGRERIFRGINLCVKDDRAHIGTIEREYLKEKLFDNLDKCGINVIRLGTTWASIEPCEGQYNDKLINVYKKFVAKCKEHNIYVMLDMHQDLFSSLFHGDGAPKWAIDKSIKGKKYFAIWAEGYFYMDSVAQAFYNFWHNKDGIMDSFVRAWKYYVHCFKGYDNIIGYDFLNEPYVDKNGRTIFLSIVKSICKTAFNKDYDFTDYFKPGRDKIGFALMALKLFFTVRNRKRLHSLLCTMDSRENFSKAIDGIEIYTNDFNSQQYQSFIDNMDECVNKENIFTFFEHNYYSNLGIPFEIKIRDNYIYSPHAYDLFIDSPLYSKYSSNNRVSVILENIRKNQLKMNVPVLFGEWGGGGPKGGKWIEHIDYIMDVFEKYHWSAIYWAMNFSDKKLVNVYNRPYPVAVCGDIINIHTDSGKRRFCLEWNQGSDFDNKDAKTVVFVPDKGFTQYLGKTGINKIEIEY